MQPESLKPSQELSVPVSSIKQKPSNSIDTRTREAGLIHSEGLHAHKELSNASKVTTTPGETARIFQEDIIEIERDLIDIVGEEQAAEALAHMPHMTLYEITKDDRVVERVLNRLAINKNLYEAISIPLGELLSEFIQDAKEHGVEGVEFGHPILNLPENIQGTIDNLVNVILRTQLAVQIPTQIVMGGLIITRKHVIEAAERLMGRIKSGEVQVDQETLLKLQTVILEQKDALEEQVRDFIIINGSYIPQAMEVINKIQGSVSPYMTILGAGTALGWVATSAYDMWKAFRGQSRHSDFIKEHTEISDKQASVALLLEKRKSAQRAIRASLKEELSKLTDTYSLLVEGLTTNKSNFNFIVHEFRSQGINLSLAYQFCEAIKDKKAPEGIEREVWLSDELDRLRDNGETFTPEHLHKVWKDENFRFALLSQFAEHKQTLTIQTKGAVKALSMKKLESERKFFDFRVGSTATLFAISTIAAAGTIALKVLACAGIIAATSIAISIPGLGLFVGGAILLAVGLLFLYKYKPNLFKGLLKGTAIALAFNKIPQAYYSYQLHKAKSLRDEKAAYVNCLSARIDEIEKLKLAPQKPVTREMSAILSALNTSMEQLDLINERLAAEMQHYQQQRHALDDKIKEIEETLEVYKERVDELKFELSDRGTRDFLQAANYSSRTDRTKVLDVPAAIAENIAIGNIDDETKAIFKQRMDIDFDKHHYDVNELRSAMIHFFGLDRENMERLIRKLKIRQDALAGVDGVYARE